MAKKKSAEALLEQLESCTEETISELDERIAEKEQARDQAVAQLDKQIAALKSVRKIIDLRLHGKPPRKKPVRKKKGQAAPAEDADQQETETQESGSDDGEKSLEERIYDVVFDDGPQTYAQLAGKLGVHHTSVRHAINRQQEWFEVEDGQVSIAKAK